MGEKNINYIVELKYCCLVAGKDKNFVLQEALNDFARENEIRYNPFKVRMKRAGTKEWIEFE